MKKLSIALQLLLPVLFIFSTTTCNTYDCSCFKFGGIDSEITKNHEHSLEIPAEDFNNPHDGTYSIKGEADHDHKVTFSAEDLEIVSGNNSKTVTSTQGGSDNHTHEVTLDCSCY